MVQRGAVCAQESSAEDMTVEKLEHTKVARNNQNFQVGRNRTEYDFRKVSQNVYSWP